MTRKFNFYVLIDPRDDKIKYMGRTVNPSDRYRNHLYEARKNNRNRRERWISLLLGIGLKPKMKILYTIDCTLEEAIQTERTFIKKLISKGYNLKNMPDSYLGTIGTGSTIYQYDVNTKELLNTFCNAHLAMIETGVRDCNISRCAKDENGYGSKTAGGFFWSFNNYDKYPHDHDPEFRRSKGKPVDIYTLDGDLVGSYITSRMAAKDLGISYKAISACANEYRKSINNKYTAKFK